MAKRPKPDSEPAPERDPEPLRNARGMEVEGPSKRQAPEGVVRARPDAEEGGPDRG